VTITPNGAPSWTRAAGFADYGGDANKANYQGQGVVNPKTDVGAEAVARLTSELAAVVRTAPFATLHLKCNDSSPAAPTVYAVLMQTGVTTVDYPGDAPPTGFPACARVSAGKITVTFSSSYQDAYGVAAAYGITHATAALNGTAAGSEAVSFTEGALVLTVSFFNAAGSALSDAEGTIEVW